MSGHSKWHKIQHKKGKADKARSNMFTKLLRGVTVAAQQGGGDPDMNFSLRLAVDKAKAGNVPKDNIERAIKKGTGEVKDGVIFEEIMYEGFGPHGVALLIEALTDNKNRTVSEVKHILTKHGGSMAGPGSVQWQFEHRGVVRFSAEERANIRDWDSAQMMVMDAGVLDIEDGVEGVTFICAIEHLQDVLKVVDALPIESIDFGLEWIPKETMDINDMVEEQVTSLYDALEENDDVKNVFINI